MWVILKDKSHEIISCNVHQEGDVFQLWVTRPNDKSLKLMESKDKELISTSKEAIDYAIKHGEPAFEIA